MCSTQTIYWIRAKSFASLRKRNDPHNLVCALSKSEPHDVTYAYCSCAAGKSGYCSHVLALLYQTSHYYKYGCDSSDRSVSKTSIPQVWDKPRIEGIKSEPVMEVTVKKARIDAPSSSKCVDNSLYEARVKSLVGNDVDKLATMKAEAASINPLYGISYMIQPDHSHTSYTKTSMGFFVPDGSVLSSQLAPTEGDFDVECDMTKLMAKTCNTNCTLGTEFPNFPLDSVPVFDIRVPDAFSTLYQSICITPQQSADLESKTQKQSQSDDWFEARKYRITASAIHEITHRKSKSLYKWMERKLNQRKILPSRMPYSLKHGHEYEQVAINRYMKYMSAMDHAVTVQPCGFVVTSETPYLGCTPDGRVTDHQAHPHYGLLEVKCPYTHRGVTPTDAAASDDKFCLSINQKGKLFLRKTHPYYYQVQAQMAITCARWSDFVVYTFKGMFIDRIEFDSVFWNDVHKKAAAFYIEKMLPELTKFM